MTGERDTLRTAIERWTAASAKDARRAEGLGAVSEGTFLEVIDEVRDVVMTDLTRAITMGEALVALSDRAGLPAASARARSVMAHALNYANRFEDAIGVLEEARTIAGAHGLRSEEARAGLAMTQSLARLGRFGDAIEAARGSAAGFEALGERSEGARALANLGILLRMTGEYARSVEMFDRAIGLAGAGSEISAQVASNRAESLLEMGAFVEAERGFREAGEALEARGMRRVAAIVQGNLADLLGRQGRFPEAIEAFERARRYFESDHAQGDLARIESELADVLVAVGDNAQARALYERAAGTLGRVGLAQELARCLLGHAALLVRDAHEDAGDVLDRAERTAEEIDARETLMRLGLLRAKRALASCSAPDPHLGVVLGRAAEHEPPLDRISRLSLLAEFHEKSENPDKARRIIHETIGLATELGLPPVLADLHHRLGTLLESMGLASEAGAMHERAVREIERLRGSFGSDRFRAAFLGDRERIIRSAADAALRRGQTELAFEIGERARCRTLLDQFVGPDPGGSRFPTDDAALLQGLAEAKAESNYLYSRLGSADGPGRASEWLEQLRETESRIDELETRLASGSGAVYGASPITARELRGSLGSGRTLLVFHAHGSGLGCFVIDAQSVRHCDLGVSIEAVEDLGESLGFQLRRAVTRSYSANGRSARRIGAALAASRALHERVLSPLLDGVVDGNEIVVAPFGPLHQVPFGALHDGDSYLIERFAVTQTPAAGLVPRFAREQARPAGRPLLVGVADELAPEIEHELTQAGASLADSETISGSDATSERVIEAMSSRPIVHLATHGMFPRGNPLAAALKLADRWVGAREFASCDLRGSVVVLSGCETGRAELGTGEESYGLIRSFLAAGASGVVSTLWSTHDRTARELMSRMYAGAVETSPGVHPASGVFTGLRRAQRWAVSEGLHPGLWSGFVPMGVAS